MQHLKMILALFLTLAIFGTPVFAEEGAEAVAQSPVLAQNTAAQPALARPIVNAPYRTFLTIQRYTLETNGDPGTNISNARLELKFPNDVVIKLPGGDQYWPIGNGQVQEVNQTFEIPWANIKGDSFGFVLQIVRKGAQILPCQFDVKELSQFNRTYHCQTDVGWQTTNNVPAERIIREGVQIRVFTDRNTPSKEVPKDAVALK